MRLGHFAQLGILHAAEHDLLRDAKLFEHAGMRNRTVAAAVLRRGRHGDHLLDRSGQLAVHQHALGQRPGGFEQIRPLGLGRKPVDWLRVAKAGPHNL